MSSKRSTLKLKEKLIWEMKLQYFNYIQIKFHFILISCSINLVSSSYFLVKFKWSCKRSTCLKLFRVTMKFQYFNESVIMLIHIKASVNSKCVTHRRPARCPAPADRRWRSWWSPRYWRSGWSWPETCTRYNSTRSLTDRENHSINITHYTLTIYNMSQQKYYQLKIFISACLKLLINLQLNHVKPCENSKQSK